MKRKQRFIVSFKPYGKDVFITAASNAAAGINENPDFRTAPVSSEAFKTAFDQMVAASPRAVPEDIDGLRIFKPLREAVEAMMIKLANFAQSTIGDKPERMEASGLPLTKEPSPNRESINMPMEKPKLVAGKTPNTIDLSVKSNTAASGIVIEERQSDGTFKEIKKVSGFRASINGWQENDVVVLQSRYWNNEGVGPLMQKPLAIVV